MYGRSCAAALSYVSTCNARQVCSACREQERIKAINTPRPHKTRSELNSESSLRRRPNRECRHERRSPPGRAPKRAAPPPSAPRPARPGGRGSATAPPRTAQPGAGRDPSARGRPRSPGAAAARARCWSPCRARLTFVPRTPRRAVSGLREKR